MKYELMVTSATFYEDKVFFIPRGIKRNCLFEYDIKTDDVTELCSFLEYSVSEHDTFSSIIYSDGFIYLITLSIDSVIIFNISTREYTKVKMPFDGEGMIINAVKEGDNIYIFDAKKPNIYIYNIVKNDFTENNKWIKDLEPYIFDKKDIFFRKQVVKQDGFLVIPFCNANAVLIMSTENFECRVVNFFKDKNGYAGIIYDNGEYWLFPRRNDMYILCCDKLFENPQKINIDTNENFRCFGVTIEDKSFNVFGIGAEKMQIEDKEHMYIMKNDKELLYVGDKTIYTDVYDGDILIKSETEEQEYRMIYDMSANDMDILFTEGMMLEKKRFGLEALLEYVTN